MSPQALLGTLLCAGVALLPEAAQAGDPWQEVPPVEDEIPAGFPLVTAFHAAKHPVPGLWVRLLEVDGSASTERDPITLFLVVSNNRTGGREERVWRLPNGVTRVLGLTGTDCGATVRVEVNPDGAIRGARPQPRALHACFLAEDGRLDRTLRLREGPDNVFVELETDDERVRIDAVTPEGGTRPICSAPCRQFLPRDGRYVIQGEGISATPRFLLPDDQVNARLRVRAGSKAWTGIAVLTFVLGSGAALAGSLAQPHNEDPSSPKRPPPTWSLPVSLTGLGAMLAGGALYFEFGRTRVWSSSGRSF